MKKIIGGIIFIAIIGVGVFVSYMLINSNDDSKIDISNVKIIQNNYNLVERKEISITNEEYIKEIEIIYNKMLKLDADYYDLALGETTDIILNDKITIVVQLSNPDLCTYSGLASAEFIETPKELIGWINKVL